MGSESRLRRRHREAIRAAYPRSVVVSQPASAYTGAGRTDFYVIVGGRFVGLELKTGMGRATQVQLDRIRKVREAGGYAAVVRHPDQSLALIRHALAGGSVWDNLFDDTQPEVKVDQPRLDEIRAFKEPEVQAEIQLNGVAPSGDGVMQEPPADYPFAVIIQRLDSIGRKLDRIMSESGITPLDQDPPVQVQEAVLEPSPAPPSRSRSRKKQ